MNPVFLSRAVLYSYLFFEVIRLAAVLAPSPVALP